MSKQAAKEEVDIDDLPVIDEAHLSTFVDNDRALERELAELYQSTVLGYLKRMQEAIEEERPWSAEAHALKGASANLGARRAAELARRAEFLQPSADYLKALRSAVEEVKIYFDQREL